MPRLTDVTVRSLPEGLHFDEQIPSFGIRVGKRRRTWLVIKGKNRTKVTIGHYPALSLKDARQKAYLALGSPAAPKSAPTFTEALDAYLAQNTWRERGKKELERSLRRHFTWTRPLNRITHEDIAEALEKISAISERRHALNYLKTFLNWCVPRYLDTSPAQGLRPPKHKSRERTLSDEELKAVWQAAGQMGNYGLQIRALILTGQRINQMLKFEQHWIGDGAVTFPASIMKSGREHRIPLCPMAAEMFARLHKTGYQSRAKARLDQLSGITGWTPHDLRRTFSTNLARLKVPQHITEKLLDHNPKDISGVAAIYNRYTFFDEMAEALTTWENWLQSIVGR